MSPIINIWQDLGIEAGTGIILLIVLYFVIRGAVKSGMISAFEEIAEEYGFKKQSRETEEEEEEEEEA
ncbi:MAG: hypothetical protein IJ446_04005 [Oscillospiraceae bacterium]|nr:hypothetical protein [Oscillospiraceae bacterium]